MCTVDLGIVIGGRSTTSAADSRGRGKGCRRATHTSKHRRHPTHTACPRRRRSSLRIRVATRTTVAVDGIVVATIVDTVFATGTTVMTTWIVKTKATTTRGQNATGGHDRRQTRQDGTATCALVTVVGLLSSLFQFPQLGQLIVQFLRE